jgi:uncharacterized glyoxalase superfamily protein PhnB
MRFSSHAFGFSALAAASAARAVACASPLFVRSPSSLCVASSTSPGFDCRVIAAEQQPNITIEVDDVDAVHARAVGLGLQVVYPLTDEPWGVRRFFVTDPSGVVINVMSHK